MRLSNWTKIINCELLSKNTRWFNSTKHHKVRAPFDFADYLDEYFVLSADATNGGGVRWECLPYQRRLCYLMQDADVRRVVLVKGAQVGYTQLLRGAVAYACAEKSRNVCVFEPTQQDAREFSNLQIKSMLRDCDGISCHLRVDHTKVHPDNTTHRRVWNNAVSYFRGATSANDFRRISVDWVMVDEIDGMEANIEGEGAPDTLAWSRTFASNNPKIIIGSTPTVLGESNVLRCADEIDAKFKNYLPCVHCGEFQEIVFGGADANFGLKFDKCSNHRATADTTRYRCKHCQCDIGYEHLREMDEQGELRSETIGIKNSGFVYDLETGKPCDLPHEAAAYLSGLMSYTVSWADGVYQFLKATESARQGDNSALITVTNEWLGEGYMPSHNRDLATWQQVKEREIDDEFVPDWASHLTQWADVQKDSVHVMLVAWGEGERSRVMRYDIVQGDPASDNTLEWITEQAQLEFPKRDGTYLPISLSGIDSGFLTDTVYKACKADPSKIFPTKGLSTYGKPVIEMKNRPNGMGVYICPIGTDTGKDIIAERLKLDIDGPGKIEFGTHANINDELYRSCTSNIKKIVFRSGKSVERWTLPAGRHDEGLDCLVGNLGMVRLLQQRFHVTLGDTPKVNTYQDDDGAMLAKLLEAQRS